MKLRLKISHVVLFVLLCVAFFLSIAILMKYYMRVPMFTPKSEVTKSIQMRDTILQTELLDVPGQDATDEVKSKHYKLVLDHAKTASFLNISECNADPVAMEVRIGAPVQIRNNDEEAHEIAFNKTTRFTIPAKSSESYAIPFQEGPGIYGFACDRKGRTAGIFFAKP